MTAAAHADDYTAEIICQCMGLPSFNQDPACLRATEAVRLLLKPSFHPEVCITFAQGRVSVVAARFMIWRLFEPAPMLTDRAEAAVDAAVFAKLLESLAPVAHPGAVPGIMIDGMPVALLHVRQGAVVLDVGGNGGRQGDFSAFIALAVTTAWERIANPHVRNALAEAGNYVGHSLPRDPDPVRKPTIETLVLGPEEERAQLLKALRKHHDE